MIERKSFSLSAAPAGAARLTHLTHAAAAQWSGVLRLGRGERFVLRDELRHDLYVVEGDVCDNAGSRLCAGDFVSRAGGGVIAAETAPALLFAYHERPPANFTSHRVALGDRRWHAARAPLMDVATLSDNAHRVSLVRWHPGARIPSHAHRYGEEILVLEGELRSRDERYPAGTWLRLHADSAHEPFVDVPTLILLRTGHLQTPPARHPASGLASLAQAR